MRIARIEFRALNPWTATRSAHPAFDPRTSKAGEDAGVPVHEEGKR